ncbi:hypothetical protein CHISP_0449 [Chitinispirillum alkaliphilum]|nr:hypothetical protein CHISP_0449 [Chitinispirillum alkaliphilum]
MKYKILIKKCQDSQRATRIAEEIARWSGSQFEVVYNAITKKPVCIRKEADEEEANRVRSQFTAIGAEVELVELGAPAPAAPDANTARPPVDDDEEEPGRVLTDEEYAQRLKERGDIFVLEKDSRLRNLEIVVLILAIALGVWMTTLEIVDVATDFFDRLPEERTARLITTDEIDATLEEKEEEPEEVQTDQKSLREQKNSGSGRSTGGGETHVKELHKKAYLVLYPVRSLVNLSPLQTSSVKVASPAD